MIVGLVLLIALSGCTQYSADGIAEDLDVPSEVNQSSEALATGIPNIGDLPDTAGAGLDDLGSFGSDTVIPTSINVTG